MRLVAFFLQTKLLVNSLFRICFFLRSSENKAYPLLMENKVTYVYCHMTMATISTGECGDGGWTLVMKIDGNQVKLKINEWMNEIREQTDYLPRFTFNFRHGSYRYVLPLGQPSLVLEAILPPPPPPPPPSNGNRKNWPKKVKFMWPNTN